MPELTSFPVSQHTQRALDYVLHLSVHVQLCIQLVRSSNFICLSQFRTFDLFTVLWGQTVWPNTSLLTVSVKESLVSQ